MSLFTKAEADKIAQVVGEVEQRTAGEIVVAEVARCDDYAEVRLFAAALFGLSIASGAHLLWPVLSVGAVLALQCAAGVLAWFVSSQAWLLRLLLPPRRVDRALARAAELAFLEHAVFATRDRTGVLIFLSALEHRVLILGDEGIHARVRATGWQELVTALVAAIKVGRAGEGVCDVIYKLGAALAEAAPVRTDDVDELDNRVRGP